MPEQSRALFIGVSKFEWLDDLPAVGRNLSTLVDLFAGDVWGLGASRCTQLLNPLSARDADEAIFRTAEAATDTFLLYYGGHGLLDRAGRLHLAMPDSDQRSVHSTALPYDWVRMGLSASRAQRGVVVLDCCFSARAMGLQSTASSMVELAEAEGTYVLAAAAENAFALAPPDEAFTAFTGALVSVLSNGISDAPQLLDLDTVFRGVQSIFRRQGRPDPQCLGRNQVGRMAFTRNPAYVPDQATDVQSAIQGLHLARSLADTLQTVADGVVDGLGYELACVHLVRPDRDLVAAAFSGNAQAEALITGRVGSRDAWDRRLSMGQKWGDLVFIPHTAERIDDDVPQWYSDGPAPRSENGWHPSDQLFAPMFTPGVQGGSRGELIGVLSVDRPRNGQRPSQQQCLDLQSYAFHAALAISNARLRANMQRALVDLERQQQALRASEESFRQAFERGSSLAITELEGDSHGRILRANDALCRLLGRPVSAMRNRSFSDLVHPEDTDALATAMEKGERAELRLGRRDSTYVWVTLRTSLVADAADGPRFLLISIEDIEERKRRELQLIHQLNHDALTGLPNRNGLIAHLDSRLGESADATAVQKAGQPPQGRRHKLSTTARGAHGAAGQGLALLCLNIAGTRRVNTRFGREAGDTVLTEVARRLTNRIPEGAMVARLVDDEFAVLADELDEASAHNLAVQLRNEILQPIRAGGRAVRVGATISITWPRPGTTTDAVLKAAALQLEKARSSQPG